MPFKPFCCKIYWLFNNLTALFVIFEALLHILDEKILNDDIFAFDIKHIRRVFNYLIQKL